MTISFHLLLIVLALVLLALAGLKVNEHPRISFGWWGLFCWLLSMFVTK